MSGSDVAARGLAAVLPGGTILAGAHCETAISADTDVVVRSDAIPRDNPELRRAQTLTIPTLSYFDAVGQLMEGHRGLAVAGTHGKSTTTAMAAWIMAEAGLDPTVVCGAATVGQPSGGRAGLGPIVLAEACEYRANFLKLRPQSAVILAVEPDHFDCYPTAADVESAFGRFAASLPADGLLLALGDCAATRRVAAAASCRVETFGLDVDNACDWRARPIGHCGGRYRFDLLRHGEAICRIELPMPGRHNVLNALAAAALAWHEGVEPRRIAETLGRFPGVERRLETLGPWRGATAMDDYAHHPTELAAALATVREMHPDGRICCVFQPHQASRTARLLDELAASLHNGLVARGGSRRADRLWVADIFRAREPEAAPGEVTAADLADRLRALGHDAAGVHSLDAIARDLGDRVEAGDVVLVMGAGDVRRVLGQQTR